MNRTWRIKNDERGFSLVFVALGFMGFLSASMLAIDVGMLMTARNQAQNAADAGALGGAAALLYDNYNDRRSTGPPPGRISRSASTSRWRSASRSSPAVRSTTGTSPTATRPSTTGAIR